MCFVDRQIDFLFRDGATPSDAGIYPTISKSIFIEQVTWEDHVIGATLQMLLAYVDLQYNKQTWRSTSVDR